MKKEFTRGLQHLTGIERKKKGFSKREERSRGIMQSKEQREKLKKLSRALGKYEAAMCM